ncbi:MULTISPECIES: hypothetical protein [Myroides]|nr:MULTISPECIES: hypothetical protein [Myroides]UVD80398.1 hypothetical protein NWE55_03780 [Myroides albus]
MYSSLKNDTIHCFIFGEAVDTATGRVTNTNTDIELQGAIPSA